MIDSQQLQLVSSYFGKHSSLTLTKDANVQLRIFLKNLPHPEAYEIYMNGKVVSQSLWNSGMKYEENIPLTGLSAGTYTFYAQIYFSDKIPTLTTNTVTLIIVSPDTTTNKQIYDTVAQEESSINITKNEMIAIGAGLASVIAVGGLAFYFLKKKA